MNTRDCCIYRIKKQFLCCAPIKIVLNDLINNRNMQIDIQFQKNILDSTINNVLMKKYPLKISYQKLFLKNIIKELEFKCEDIADELYDVYCKLMASQDEAAQTHYRHFILSEQNDSLCLTIQESTSLISQGTTGLCSWQAATVLVEWCIEHKDKFEGKTVLELGAGVGLLGLAVINICSPKQYIFSDGHLKVIDMLSKNILTNCTNVDAKSTTDERLKLHLVYNSTDVQVINLLWEDIDAWVSESCIKPDIILAADVLFDNKIFTSLVSGLKSLLSWSESYGIIAATVRNETTVSQFLNELGNHNILHEDEVIPKQKFFVQWDDIPVRVIKISSKTM